MNTIQKCVEELPEVYQCIYGYPEYNQEASRQCDDRWECIRNIVKTYQEKCGRQNLKVLDLGCAQGFYSFSLASIGCIVDGIDFNEKNIALCKELQGENQLSCSFRRDIITKELIGQIAQGQYDLILVFSVIHHIAHEHGFEYAQKLMTTLAEKAQFVLAEIAMKEEPLYWNQNLPNRYVDWFSDVSFYDEQRFFGTHLSEYRRPLVFYSNQFCFVNGSFYFITEYKKTAYEGRPIDPGRQYYLCEGNTILIKKIRDVGQPCIDECIDEIHSEYQFLLSNNDLSFAPKPLCFSENEQRIIMVTEIKYGTLLKDLIEKNEKVDLKSVFRDIINQCIELEERGMYHNDLRPWNICVDQTGHAFLIDFGAIQRDKEDRIVSRVMYSDLYVCHTVYDSFVAMMYDCLINNCYPSLNKLNRYHMSFYYEFEKIPQAYSNFIQKYLLEEQDKASFDCISELYDRYVEKEDECTLSVEEQLCIQKRQLSGLNLQKESSIRSMERIYDLGVRLDKDEAEIAECKTAIASAQKELAEYKAMLVAAKDELQDVTTSILELRQRLNNEELRIENEGAKNEELRLRLGAIERWLPLRTWKKATRLLKTK